MTIKDNAQRIAAEADYRRSIRLDPINAVPWNGLGYLLSADQQRQAEAEAAYRYAISLDPIYVSAWNNLYVLLRCQKRETEAEAACINSLWAWSQERRSVLSRFANLKSLVDRKLH